MIELVSLLLFSTFPLRVSLRSSPSVVFSSLIEDRRLERGPLHEVMGGGAPPEPFTFFSFVNEKS